MERYAKTEQYTAEVNEFWEIFIGCAGRVFITMRGLRFSFDVIGNEIFFDRKAKSVIRSTVICGYRKALELVASGVQITTPKQFGVFGASYLLPVLAWLGVVKC